MPYYTYHQNNNYYQQNTDRQSTRNLIAGIIIIIAFIVLCLAGVVKVKNIVTHQQIATVQQSPRIKHVKRIKQSRHTKRDFIKQIARPARLDYEKNYQVTPSIVIAQAIIESDYGQSKLYTRAKNPFGIKWNHHGKYITYKTVEFYNGRKKIIHAKFAKYPSLKTAIKDHNQLLTQLYLRHRDVTNPNKAAKLLQKHGYATNADYAHELTWMIKKWHLKRYDRIS